LKKRSARRVSRESRRPKSWTTGAEAAIIGEAMPEREA
jgi:hypothetical protein